MGGRLIARQGRRLFLFPVSTLCAVGFAFNVMIPRMRTYSTTNKHTNKIKRIETKTGEDIVAIFNDLKCEFPRGKLAFEVRKLCAHQRAARWHFAQAGRQAGKDVLLLSTTRTPRACISTHILFRVVRAASCLCSSVSMPACSLNFTVANQTSLIVRFVGSHVHFTLNSFHRLILSSFCLFSSSSFRSFCLARADLREVHQDQEVGRLRGLHRQDGPDPHDLPFPPTRRRGKVRLSGSHTQAEG